MALETLTLIPGEKWVNCLYSFARKAEVIDGEILTGTPTATVDPPTAVTISAITIVGSSVKFTITSTTAAALGSREVRCTVETDGGAVLPDVGNLRFASVRATNRLEAVNVSERLYAVDFSLYPMIVAGQVLTGTPTVVWDDATDLVTTPAAVSGNLAPFRVEVALGASLTPRTGLVTVSTTAGSILKLYVTLPLDDE